MKVYSSRKIAEEAVRLFPGRWKDINTAVLQISNIMTEFKMKDAINPSKKMNRCVSEDDKNKIIGILYARDVHNTFVGWDKLDDKNKETTPLELLTTQVVGQASIPESIMDEAPFPEPLENCAVVTIPAVLYDNLLERCPKGLSVSKYASSILSDYIKAHPFDPYKDMSREDLIEELNRLKS